MLSLEHAPPFPLRGRPFPIYRGSCTILPAYLSRFPSAMAETRLVKTIGWSFLILPRNHGGSCVQAVDSTSNILGLNDALDSFLQFVLTFERTSNTWKERSSNRGVAAAIEDRSIKLTDFFKSPLPSKFLMLLGYLALFRVGMYIPIGGIKQEAFVCNLGQNSLSTLDSLSGGGIGRLGVCSLGITPFINSHTVIQLLTQIFPKLQGIQKEGEAGRKKVLQYTRYMSVGIAMVQATGQVLYLRPYANDFSATWVLSSVALLTVGSAFTTCIAEKISDLKLGNGASLLIFTNIISYLPASFGRTVSQAFQDENYIGLIAVVISFVLLIIGTVYVQEAERKIPLNYASRYSNKSRHLQKAAYLPFKVNSSGAMPMIFSISSLALPDTFACLTGSVALKEAVYAFNPGGVLYHSTNILLIAFFNYYYTFLQLDPNDVSEQLKHLGASIPYVRPGKSTAAYLKTVLTRVSILGSTFLAGLAVGPAVIEHMTHLTVFGGCTGTSVLILVDCATDMARKVQAEIISQKYKNIELYNIEKSPNLKILSVRSSQSISDASIPTVASRCRLLTELDISNCYEISYKSLEIIGRGCPNLRILKRNMLNWLDPSQHAGVVPDSYLRSCPQDSDREAGSIGQFMPELRCLELRFSKLSIAGLVSISEGCLDLELLDLFGCANLTGRALEHASANLKSLKTLIRPNFYIPRSIFHAERYGHWRLYDERFQTNVFQI